MRPLFLILFFRLPEQPWTFLRKRSCLRQRAVHPLPQGPLPGIRGFCLLHKVFGIRSDLRSCSLFFNHIVMHNMGVAMILIMAITAGCGPGSGSSHGEEPEARQEEILQHTLFTPETEFFIEHPALVAGEEALFLIHATRLDSYRPYDSATLTLQMGEWSLRLTEPALDNSSLHSSPG